MLRALEQRYSSHLNKLYENECEEIFQQSIPYCYQPNQIQYPMTYSEKIFASCWLGEDTLALGTKDNILSIWNVHHNQVFSLPLPYISASYDRGCGIHDIDYCQLSSNGLMISGSDSPNDIALFETKSFKPIGLLKGHSDWIFGCKFINENVIFSGGKDGVASFWKIDKATKRYSSIKQEREMNEKNSVTNGNSFPIIKPFHQCSGRFDKIRCVSVDKTRQLCYSLNTIGTVTIWNAEAMVPIQEEVLDDYFELISMDVKEYDNLIAVGSRSYTSLIDPRVNGEITCISHVDLNWGVRKVLFLDNYLIIGGGSGVVSFVDLRKHDNYRHIIYHRCDGVARHQYQNVNENDIPQAVYTMSYNTSKTNLFVGGGPLLVEVSGYFGSVWN